MNGSVPACGVRLCGGGGSCGVVRRGGSGRSCRGGSSRDRRRSCSRRRPLGVMVRPRQPREARSRTAQTRDRSQMRGGEQSHTRPVVNVPGQRRRDNRPGIDQHHAGRRPRPSAMISSTRSETSSDEPSANANHAGGHPPPRPEDTSRDRKSPEAAAICSSGNRSTSRCSSSLASSFGAVMVTSLGRHHDHVPKGDDDGCRPRSPRGPGHRHA